MLPEDFAQRIGDVRERMARAAARSGRDEDAITLVAVTKGHPASLVRAAVEVGLRDIGENRVYEMLDKQATLDLPDARWHFIGHLQRRKVRDLIGHCDLVHSVDRLSLAQELDKRAAAAGATVSGLLQVNASGEESKGGWEVDSPAGGDAFLAQVEQVLALPHLRIQGLMTMAPFYEEAERTRPTFAHVRTMQQRLVERFPDHDFSILSMGMSNDFEIAIEEGATHVRLGTALFGPRPT